MMELHVVTSDSWLTAECCTTITLCVSVVIPVGPTLSGPHESEVSLERVNLFIQHVLT